MNLELTEAEAKDLRVLVQAEIRRNVVADAKPSNDYVQRLDSIRDKL